MPESGLLMRAKSGKSWHEEHPREDNGWSWCGLRTDWAETTTEAREPRCAACRRAKEKGAMPRTRVGFGEFWRPLEPRHRLGRETMYALEREAETLARRECSGSMNEESLIAQQLYLAACAPQQPHEFFGEPDLFDQRLSPIVREQYLRMARRAIELGAAINVREHQE